MSLKSKMHVFIEFGLHELWSVLKSKVFDPELNEDVGRLDPFVDIVLQCLQLKYDQVSVPSRRWLGVFTRCILAPIPGPRWLRRSGDLGHCSLTFISIFRSLLTPSGASYCC